MILIKNSLGMDYDCGIDLIEGKINIDINIEIANNSDRNMYLQLVLELMRMNIRFS